MKEILQMCRLHFYVICFMIPFKEKNLHNIFLKQNHQKHTSFRRRKIFFKFSFNWVIDILMINRVVISPSHLWLQILAKLWEQEQKPKGFFFIGSTICGYFRTVHEPHSSNLLLDSSLLMTCAKRGTAPNGLW